MGNSKIDKIISTKQTGANRMSGGVPELEVIFEAGGKAFKWERVVQFGQPELHQIQYQADSKPEWFWQFAAKPVVL